MVTLVGSSATLTLVFYTLVLLQFLFTYPYVFCFLFFGSPFHIWSCFFHPLLSVSSPAVAEISRLCTRLLPCLRGEEPCMFLFLLYDRRMP